VRRSDTSVDLRPADALPEKGDGSVSEKAARTGGFSLPFESKKGGKPENKPVPLVPLSLVCKVGDLITSP
jgi:hypothetical protein